jgi:endonuclease YncB( thermonuclease family)
VSAPTVSAAGAVAKPVHTFAGKVVKVYDADTIWVETAKETRKVRLDRIDAPEANQAWGKEAALAAREFLLGQKVTVDWSERDRYGRYLGTVNTTDGNLIDPVTFLVGQGHAWVYRAYCMDPALLKLEAEAKAAQRGLWSQPNPQPPWEYRRAQRIDRQPKILRGLRARPLAPLLPLRR